MTMIRLIVKGTREVAVEAARSYGLEVEWQYATHFGEQVLMTVADPPPDAITRWFHDQHHGGWHLSHHHGYPPGTLLWYRIPDRAPLTPA